MKTPTFFRDYARNYREGDYVEFDIADTGGTEFFEIWYYGELYEVYGAPEPYIVNTEEAPAKIVARNPQTGAEILLYDGSCFGYDNMFCDEYTPEQVKDRPLQKLDMPPVKLTVKLGYSIDYADEKEDYDFDDAGLVELISGASIPWEQVLTDGFDYYNLTVVTEDGRVSEIADFELA